MAKGDFIAKVAKVAKSEFGVRAARVANAVFMGRRIARSALSEATRNLGFGRSLRRSRFVTFRKRGGEPSSWCCVAAARCGLASASRRHRGPAVVSDAQRWVQNSLTTVATVRGEQRR
jgi:hypothetical protein